jgi:hypothetical protein
MKRFLILISVLLIVFPSLTLGDNDKFNWSLYEETLQDIEMESAAKCEAMDLTLYGDSRYDYSVELFAIHMVAYNLKKVPVEMELAYYNLRSYHLGKIEGSLGHVDSKKASNNILENASDELGCHRNYKKMP